MQTVATQIRTILTTGELTVDELGLIYCYKHGVSVNQALKALGSSLRLPELLNTMSDVVLENGKVCIL